MASKGVYLGTTAITDEESSYGVVAYRFGYYV